MDEETGPRAVLLARHPEYLQSLSLPERSRPTPVSEAVVLSGPWSVAHPKDGVIEYHQPAPIRGIEWGFRRSQAPSDVRLKDDRGVRVRWRYTRNQKKAAARTWDVASGQLRIRRASGQPEPSDWTLDVPRLAQLEASLQLESAGRAPEDFALRSVSEGGVTRHGLFLPAPAEARFSVPVSVQGTGLRLRTTARLLPPFVPHGRDSDGAAVVVRADGAELYRGTVSEGEPLRIDVAVPEAKTLTTATETGETGDLDYVFFDEPALLRPRTDPRRVLIVLIDTLRADRLGSYGYTDHDTSPFMDQLATRGVRFDQARAPAPWTLPSTRALLSGDEPEAWMPTAHLGHHFARSGFATAFVSTNTYLSRFVDMHRGWTLHDYGLARTGPQQLRRLQAFLDGHADRDIAVVLHVMEPHMPYREPKRLRSLWAGDTPAALDEDFNVTDIQRADQRGDVDETVRQWVSDRYDQNVRAADEVVARAVEAIGPDALVVVTADHGEEFWEHGDVEHGHAVWEELVRVPLIVVGPGIAPGVVDEPVSLMDVAPTLYARMGVDGPAAGVDLGPALAGEAMPQLLQRPLAFRNLLYRSDAYGVLVNGGHKWMVREGTESVFDLSTDPGEQRSIAQPLEPFHEALASALGRPVVAGWRIALPGAGVNGNRRKSKTRITLSVTHPEGVSEVFVAPDPRDRSKLDVVPVEGGFQLAPVRGASMPTEVYVRAPSRPTVTGSDLVTLTPAVFPLPADPSTGSIEIDADAKEALEALGYME